MDILYSVKEEIARIYSRYESYIVPVLKFILLLVTQIFISANIGFMTKLKNPAIILVVSLLGAFLPMNASVILVVLIVVAHLYELSLECAVIALCVFLIMFVIYFRFSPKDSAAVLLTPIFFYLKVPYVAPVVMGLSGSPFSGVSVACGVVLYYVMDYGKKNADKAGTEMSLEVAQAMAGFKEVIDGMLKNDEMLLMAVVLALTTLVIYVAKRLELEYAWKIAIVAGSVIELVSLVGGSFVLDVKISVGLAIVGIILGIIVGLVMEFFMFCVDFSKAQNLQFQDDEYYYYVRAIPKVYTDINFDDDEDEE
ncbi:MAG: hypothetical protein K5931_11225 [Lachnospiraceae bacterium]|nr:hypothetical protein [Lachnospiraceae bacterium]